MLGDLLLKTVEKYVDVFIDTLASKYDLPKSELKSLWKETIGNGKKQKPYKKMKLDELQKLCEEREIFLKKSRKKQLYIDALEEHDKKPKDSEQEIAEEEIAPVVEQEHDPVEQEVAEQEVAPVVEQEVDPVEQEVDPVVEQEVVEEEVAPVEETKKKQVSKKKKTPLKKKGESIEDYVDKISSMEEKEEKDVDDMNFTELKKFCKEKGMDIRQKTKQQLLDWVEEKDKTTDFSEFLTDIDDLI